MQALAYTVECVWFDHGNLSTPELSDIAWSHFDYNINIIDSPKLTIEADFKK